jgi:hypothetical protein
MFLSVSLDIQFEELIAEIAIAEPSETFNRILMI